MNGVPGVIQRHQDHDGAADDVDRFQARPRERGNGAPGGGRGDGHSLSGS